MASKTFIALDPAICLLKMSHQDKQVRNKEILLKLRRDRDFLHRQHRGWRFVYYPLVLSATLPLPQLTLDQVQDSCNKPISIYWIGVKPISLCTAFNYIDQQWRSDYRNDLEFQMVASLPSPLASRARRWRKALQPLS